MHIYESPGLKTESIPSPLQEAQLREKRAGSFGVPRKLRGRASQTSRTGVLSPPGPAGRHTRLCEPRTSALQLVSSVTLGGSLGRRPHVRHAVCAGFLWRLGAHGMLPRSEAGDTRQAQPRDSVLAEGGEPAVQLWATGLQARSYKPYRPPAPSTRDPRSHRAGHERGEERRAWAGGRRAAGREKTCRLGTSLLPQAERRGCSQAPAGSDFNFPELQLYSPIKTSCGSSETA